MKAGLLLIVQFQTVSISGLEVRSKYDSFISHCNRKHVQWRHRITSLNFEERDTDSGVNFSNVEDILPPIDSDTVLPSVDDPVTNGHITLSEADQVVSTSTDMIERAGDETQQDIVLLAARFMITLKEKYKLTQTSLQFTLDSVTDILKAVSQNINLSVRKQLTELSQSSDILDVLSCCFEIDSPFKNLATEYQQTKYYKENLGLIVGCVMSHKSL